MAVLLGLAVAVGSRADDLDWPARAPWRPPGTFRETRAYLEAQRDYRRLEASLTRRFPAPDGRDFVHLYATWVSPRLVEAEARLRAAAFELSERDRAARVASLARPGSLVFRLTWSNHDWPRTEADLHLLLDRARLEVDGRFFPVARTDRPDLRRMLVGHRAFLSFDTPPGEPHLPGPSARRIRLWLPGIRNRKGRPPRVRFEASLFGDLWHQPLPVPGR